MQGDCMKLYFPQYYHQFRCIAAACPDSCCQGWAVDVDEIAAACYRSLPGDLGDRLRTVLRDDGDGAYMEIEDGRCPMWRQDGLCRIQAELGHDALCHVCRTFPRLRHDYGDFVELGLELSCPEAARLIFTAPAELCCQEADGGEEPDYEPELMDILLHSRREALALTEDSTLSVPELLAVLLLYAHEVQAQLDGAEPLPFSPAQALSDAHRYATGGSLPALLDFFKDLEILNPTWATRLDTAQKAFSRGEGGTAPAVTDVDCGQQSADPHEAADLSRSPSLVIASCRAGACSRRPWQSVPSWTDLDRPLIRYFVSRWWLQAVSDYDLISRVKLTVAACLVIHALGGDTVQTAQAFSKEIENDPDNIEAILDGAYTSPALTDVQLLSLLLHP